MLLADCSRLAAVLVLAFVLASGCSDSSAASPDDPWRGGDLNSVLWVQTGAEYRAACIQTFDQARRGLDAALADAQHTAALEQSGDYATLPPAIVCDVDETLLDNSPYNARLLRAGTSFGIESWNTWVREAAAEPLPGARAFLEYAESRGVTVFYVTNRGVEVEAATRANLESAKFPVAAAPVDDTQLDTVLTRGDHDEAGSEKSPRRTRIAQTHRIVLLLGDDLGDFAPGARKLDRTARAKLVDDHAARWGRHWFVLPNPVYGSWRSAVGDDPFGALDVR